MNHIQDERNFQIPERVHLANTIIRRKYIRLLNVTDKIETVRILKLEIEKLRNFPVNKQSH